MATSGFGILARTFSTSARCHKLVQTPIQVYGLSGSYASALYSAASKESALESVEKDLKSVKQLWEKDTKFRDFFADPTENARRKKTVFQTVVKKNSYSKVTQNLFDTMAENGRLSKLTEVINLYIELMSAHRGEVICKVTTAKALDASTNKELNGILQGFLKKGQKLYLETEVDPSLVGGMTVTIGDKFIDMSLKSKIKLYTDILKSASV
ncbi:ATP synthase subunit O, mitochondrial-like [Crassostrea virginica]